MANFTAKTKEESTSHPAAPQQVIEIPKADIAGLEFMGAGRFFIYTHAQHVERDILKPGYFDEILGSDARRYHGALILYTARGGSNHPEDWQTGILRVARLKGERGYEAMEPTKVAIVARFGKATLAAHGGEAEGKAA